jgi:hypothetical protein
MMKDNNLESTFKNIADNLNTEVRPKLWDKLEKRMDDHYASTSPTQIVRQEWMRYAAAMALLLIGGFLLSKVGSTNTTNMAQSFVIEEIQQAEEADQTYKEMVDFSHKYYNTLINPGAKRKSPL